jgi:CRISPR/Cas system-associated exonuclease Cas4 (RecB family)
MKFLETLRGVKEEVTVSPLDVPKSIAELEGALVEQIDLSFLARNQPQIKKVEGFHPSYTNQCARYWFYLFQGVEMTPSFGAQTYRIFDNGHAVHERIYGYFKEMGILIEEEIPVRHENPPIRGTADGIIDFYGLKLIELKSISMEGFEYRRIYNKPKDDHYRQAQIYMRCLDLQQAFVIYENKNNQKILPILIDRDDTFIDKLFVKYTKFYNNYLEDTIPVQPYKITSKNCSSCDLYSHCWNSQDGSDKAKDEESF